MMKLPDSETATQPDPTRWPFDEETTGADMFASAATLDEASTALFLSDLHFGDGSGTDLFGDQDRRLIELLEEYRARVDAFVFLGDIFDMPQAWSTGRIAAAHPELLAYLRDLARGREVIFVKGNHDWSVDYESLFPGSQCREAVLIGARTLAWHGHQVDLVMNPWARHAMAKMYVHALLERMVQRRLVPPLELHDSAANRVVVSLAVAWAGVRVSRAEALRAMGRLRRAEALEARVRYLARSVCGDPADIYGATARSVLGRSFDTVACGHTHVPGVVRTVRGTYVNTGTWTCGMRTCAMWTNEGFRVIDVDAGREVRDEHFVEVADDTDPHELFDWWLRAWRRGFAPGPTDSPGSRRAGGGA